MPPRGKKRVRMEDDLGDETAEAAPASKTQAIIQSVLQEEDQTKEQSKASKPQKSAQIDGQLCTLLLMRWRRLSAVSSDHSRQQRVTALLTWCCRYGRGGGGGGGGAGGRRGAAVAHQADTGGAAQGARQGCAWFWSAIAVLRSTILSTI